MKKIYKSRVLLFAAAVFWMILIFCFSNQRAEISSEISGSLTYRIAEFMSHALHLDWDGNTLVQYAREWEYPVRKAAHMTEYAIFAWILLGNFALYSKTSHKKYLLAEIGAILYASTDEFHQLFIEGRSGQFLDVCIDGMGALLGLLLAWAVISLWGKIVKNRKR